MPGRWHGTAQHGQARSGAGSGMEHVSFLPLAAACCAQAGCCIPLPLLLPLPATHSPPEKVPPPPTQGPQGFGVPTSLGTWGGGSGIQPVVKLEGESPRAGLPSPDRQVHLEGSVGQDGQRARLQGPGRKGALSAGRRQVAGGGGTAGREGRSLPPSLHQALGEGDTAQARGHCPWGPCAKATPARCSAAR